MVKKRAIDYNYYRICLPGMNSAGVKIILFMHIFLKNKLTSRILFSSFIGIQLSGVAYCLIVPFLLNYTPAERLEFWRKLAVIVPILGAVSDLIFYWIYSKAEKVINLLEAGIKPADELLQQARNILTNMNLYYMLLGLVFYPLGAIINVLPDILHGTAQFDSVFSRLLGSFFWGALAGLFTARFCNIFLIQAKSELNIYVLEMAKKDKKYETFIKRFFIPLFFLIILLSSFCILGYYHFDKETIDVKNAQINAILDKAAAAALTQAEVEQAAAARHRAAMSVARMAPPPPGPAPFRILGEAVFTALRIKT
jgi:hypothetical protein